MRPRQRRICRQGELDQSCIDCQHGAIQEVPECCATNVRFVDELGSDIQVVGAQERGARAKVVAARSCEVAVNEGW